MNSPLRGRTLLVPEAGRGVGRAIALAAARQGANIATRPGEVVTAIEAAGGRALAYADELGDERGARRLADAAAAHFGGIDAVVNLGTVTAHQDRLLAALHLTRAAAPHLRRADNPHVLSLAPPLDPTETWMGAQAPAMIEVYGMTLLTLGFATEFRPRGIAANCLWPWDLPAAATPDQAAATDRVAEAAVLVLASVDTGHTYLDVDVLIRHGITH